MQLEPLWTALIAANIDWLVHNKRFLGDTKAGGADECPFLFLEWAFIGLPHFIL